MKIKIQATEMTEGEAEYISLVPTGANRQPFKVMKSDEDGHEGEDKMSFTKMFHSLDRRQKEEIIPELLAVAVAPGADLEKAKALIEKANLATDEIQEYFEGEGDDRKLAATLFIQKGTTSFEDAGEHQVNVRLSEEIGAVCLVRQKSFMPFADTETFGDAMKSQGFFPSFRLASEVLEDKLFEISMKADSGEEMATLIGDATKDFRSALVSMAKELPNEVFKLDEVVRKADDPVSGKGATGESGVDTLADESGNKSSLPDGHETAASTMKDEDGKETAIKDETSEEGEPAAEAAATSEVSAEGSEPKETQKEESALEKLLTAVTGLGTKLDDGLAAVQKDVTSLGERVTQAESVAKSADQATRGRVRSSGDGEEGTGVTRQKDAGEGHIPFIDTALDAIAD